MYCLDSLERCILQEYGGHEIALMRIVRRLLGMFRFTQHGIFIISFLGCAPFR